MALIRQQEAFQNWGPLTKKMSLGSCESTSGETSEVDRNEDPIYNVYIDTLSYKLLQS